MGERVGNNHPVGHQQITSLAAATALTVPARARLALIQVRVAPVRWRDDGVDPTATVGIRLLADASMEYNGSLQAIRFIQESAGAILDVSYYS